MNSSSSGGKLERFFAGKGFYIVLFLCAAVIGVSTWMMASGNEAMDESPLRSSSAAVSGGRVETVVIPGEPEWEEILIPEEGEQLEAMAPPVDREARPASESAAADEGETASADLRFFWPVEGEVERGHSMEALAYDETLRDWRTHAGVDIAAPLGTPVAASCAGTVESVVSDPLYGTVMTIDHGNGFRTVYANLSELPAVGVGQWVEAGFIIGSVGETAICESGQDDHLHFAVEVNGVSADPLEYLPA